MRTNTSLTHYHKMIVDNQEVWEKKYVDAVMWQGGKGASVSMGLVEGNDVTIYIPYKSDLPTFNLGDIVVKGKIENDIVSQYDLRDVADVYNIISVQVRDYGSENMKHIELGGK